MRLLLLAALLFATPTFATELPAKQMVDWSGEPTVYTYKDWTVTIGVTGPDEQRVAELRIERPDLATVTEHYDSGGTGYGVLGFFPIDASGEESLVFGAFSGGAHCCLQLADIGGIEPADA